MAILLAGLVGGAVLLLWPREQVGPEELARRAVIQMIRSVEAKELGILDEQLSERFKHSRGWGKAEAKRYIVAQALRGDYLRIFLIDVDTALRSPTEVEVEADLLFARSEATSVQALARESVTAAYTITARYVLEADGEWRFLEGAHRRFDPSHLF